MTKLRGRSVAWWRSLGSPRLRGALLLIIVLGGVARVAWVAHAGVAPRFASDPEAYLLQGEVIARGEGYSNPLVDIENAIRVRRHEHAIPRAPSSFYPPGYPAFIAAVAYTAWHTPIPDHDLVRVIEYLQALLGALTILLVFLLARRVFDVRVGLWAAALVAFYPNLIATTATLQLETVFIALSLTTLLVVLPSAIRDDPGVPRLVVGGALIGAVALVRPTVGLLVIAFLVTRLVLRRPWRETVRDFAILAVSMVLVVMPWTIRNAVKLRAFVPISTGIGPALCMSRNSEATGALDIGILDRQCSPKRLAPPFAARDVQVNRYATSHAIHWVIGHPLEEVKMWWWRTDLAYRDDISGLDAYSPNMSNGARDAANTLSDVVGFLVLGLAAIGAVVVIAKQRTGVAALFVAATLLYAAVPLILFGDPRYRVPAEPLFAILAAAAVGAVVSRLPRSARSRLRATRAGTGMPG